jgi:hypothetical protein
MPIQSLYDLIDAAILILPLSLAILVAGMALVRTARAHLTQRPAEAGLDSSSAWLPSAR